MCMYPRSTFRIGGGTASFVPLERSLVLLLAILQTKEAIFRGNGIPVHGFGKVPITQKKSSLGNVSYL